MHKNRNGKLKMGPIWDFNIAFGNDGRSSTFEWIYQYNNRFGNDLWLVHFWYPKLMRDPQRRTKARWNQLKNNQLSSQTINTKIINRTRDNGFVIATLISGMLLEKRLLLTHLWVILIKEVDYAKE